MPKNSKHIEIMNPFKAHEFPKLLHMLRDLIIAKQKLEYDEQIQTFLANRKEHGLPFDRRTFSNEPNQIIQIKELHNALYQAEEACKKLESLDLRILDFSFATSSVADEVAELVFPVKGTSVLASLPALVSEGLALIDNAYDATTTLLKISTELEGTYRSEITDLLSNLDEIYNKILKRSKMDSLDSIGLTAGTVAGRTIKQMGLAGTPGDSDLGVYFASIFPMFPAHIETARVQIEKFAAKNPDQVPHVNQEKIEQLIEQGSKLLQTVNNSNQNVIALLFNLLSLIRQINTLWVDICKEGLNLSATSQALVREQLATFKYTIVVGLFASLDKLEVQMLPKSGRFSKPLMAQVKSWYDTLVQYAKVVVEFDKKGEKLLKLEDARFIELRLAPRRQEIEASKRLLHQISLTLEKVNALKSLDGVLQGPMNEVYGKERLQEYITDFMPYLAQYGNQEKLFSGEQNEDRRSLYTYAMDWWMGTKTTPGLKQSIDEFVLQLGQLKIDHEFKIQRRVSLIKSVEEKADMVLFPYNEPENILNKLDQVIPKELSSHEAWDLSQTIEQQLADVTRAEENCDLLLKKLESHQKTHLGRSIAFSSDYKPCLLEDNVPPKPGKFHVKIEGSTLKYAVLLEPMNRAESLKLHMKSLDNAIQAGDKGYVWDREKELLSYIAPDGQVQRNIPLTSAIDLKLLLAYKLKKNPRCFEDGVDLTYKNITAVITSHGGHHPGILRTGSIPCVEVGCTLTQLTSVAQLKSYLPRLFNEARERGHIHDKFRSQCIKLYSAIQPYLIGAFKDDQRKDIIGFDKKIAQLFSGIFYKDTTTQASLSLTDFQLKLPLLKDILSSKKAILSKKYIAAQDLIKNKAIPIEAKLSEKFRHNDVSPDIAEFMFSLDPIKRQIHDSKKTLFKIELALEHLDHYSHSMPDDQHRLMSPEANKDNEDYRYFQMFLYQLEPMDRGSYERLKLHLKQIQNDEIEQIRKNETLIASVDEKNKGARLPSSQSVGQYNVSEVCAFMQLRQVYEACLMVKGNTPKSNQLFMKVEDEVLHYQFLHYGELQTAEVALNRLPNELAATLADFNEDVIVSRDTLTGILEYAYGERKKRLDEKVSVILPDEAFDLCQWYQSRHNELEQASITFQEWLGYLTKYTQTHSPEKKAAFKLKAEGLVPLIQPYLKKAWNDDPEKMKLLDTFESARYYFTSKANGERKLKPITLFFGSQQTDLKTKIIAYKKEAQKTPLFQNAPIELNSKTKQTEDRSHRLIKHTRCSALLMQLKSNMTDLYKNLNTEFQKELQEAPSGVPYPDIANAESSAALVSWGAAIINVGILRPRFWPTMDKKKPASREKKVNIPHQVLAYMRLKNAVYYLEQMMRELEKVDDREQKIPYVLHLLASYFYVHHDIVPLVEGLMPNPHLATMLQTYLPQGFVGGKVLDPHIAGIYSSLASQVKNLADTLFNETQYYVAEDASKENKDTSILTIMKFFKVFPKRLASSDAIDFHSQYPGLEKSAEIVTAKIERIIEHYYSSYLVLFFDTLMIGHLFKELSQDITGLLNQTHDAVQRNLETINRRIDSIILEADRWEAKNGLQPGMISSPVKQIFGEFYKGLITPLEPNINKRVNLLCNTNLIDERLKAVESRQKMAEIEVDKNKVTSASMQRLLDACDKAAATQAFSQLNDVYKATLPTFKKALNGADLHVMPIDAAIGAGHKDCFVWNEKDSQLFHIDENGQINAQNGTYLSLRVIPVDVVLPTELTEKVPLPRLLRQKGCSLIWAPKKSLEDLKKANCSQYIYTPDGLYYYDQRAAKLSKISLDEKQAETLKKTFTQDENIDRLSPTQLKQITAITGHSHTQPKYMLEMKKNTLVQQGDNYFIYTNTRGKGWEYIELDKNIISNMNLNFTKTKHLNVNVKYQEMYDDIASKTGCTYPIHLNSTYRFIEFMKEKRKANASTQLYLSEHEIKQQIALNSDLVLNKYGVNLDQNFLGNVNAFSANPQNVTQLRTFVEHCKAYYESLGATAMLDKKTAEIQLSALNEKKTEQAQSDKKMAESLYGEHYDKKVSELCAADVALHEYTLCFLKNKTKVKPNNVYVNIKGPRLHYKVIDFKGMEREGSLELKSDLKCSLIKLVSLEDLQPWLPAILKKTAQAGHTRPYSLGTDYRNGLRRELESKKAAIITHVLSSTESIDIALENEKKWFDEKNLKIYQQLGEIDQAVDEMRRYLSHAEKQWLAKSSLFESSDTIKRKKEILDNMSRRASDDTVPIATRIQNIKSDLSHGRILDDLLDYQHYDSICVAALVQKVCRLFEAVGLYTPTIVKRVDKLLNVLQKEEGAEKKTPLFGFFAGSARDKLKSKIQALKTQEAKNAETKSSDGPKKTT